MAMNNPIKVGAIMPLTRPGWVDAGRQMLAGFKLAVSDVNRRGGVGGRNIELLVRDTAADPQKADTAVTELAALGIAALAGEYHSVVARAAAFRADAARLPFLCSSAVLDALIDQPTDWVARLSPPQSRGWQNYADFLFNLGHRCIGIAAEPSIYWEAGTHILKNRLGTNGGSIVEFKARELTPEELCAELLNNGVTALILLVGNPDLAASFISKIRNNARLSDILIGAPAGQPELDDWQTLLQTDGGSIPFLRYLPETLTPLGNAVASVLLKNLKVEPSFVALEGYDTIITLANVFNAFGTERTCITNAWKKVAVEGTRGLITFSRSSGSNVWQWENAPLQIAARDPENLERFNILSQL